MEVYHEVPPCTCLFVRRSAFLYGSRSEEQELYAVSPENKSSTYSNLSKLECWHLKIRIVNQPRSIWNETSTGTSSDQNKEYHLNIIEQSFT